MAIDIKAPSFPESVAEGTVATWHKQPGDSVERDELIVEIETDKVVLEVVAPQDGTLGEIKVQEGDTCESEQVLGSIGDADAAASSDAKDDSAAEESKDDAKAVFERNSSAGQMNFRRQSSSSAAASAQPPPPQVSLVPGT